jgi:tetratricopeptide (TPR) repeat protein
MAHKNQYAISLMLMLPFLGFGIYQYKKGWKWASIIAFVLVLIMIVLLQTRSVWAGILLSVIAAVFIISLIPSKFGISVKTRNIVAITTLVVLIAGGTYIDIAGKKNPWSFIGKIRSIANPDAGNNVFRLKIWGLTTKMIADHPITGVGAGNWKIHSAEYYNQYDYNFEKDQLNWLRPHNDYLWVFAEKGIFGFLFFISIFAFAIVYILKIIFSDTGPEKRTLAMFLLSGLICYLTVSFFTFPLERINQQAYLALILASVVTLFHNTRDKKKPIGNKNLILYPALIILAMTVVYSYAMLDLEFKVRKTRNAMMQSNWRVMLREAQTLSTTFRTLDLEATPIKSYEAEAYSKLGQIKKARVAYTEALEAHPTKINMMNNLGKVYYELGDYEKAKELFLEALAILPEYKEALINLSTTYYKMGKYGKTLRTLKTIPPDERNETIKRNIKAVKRKLKERKKEKG